MTSAPSQAKMRLEGIACALAVVAIFTSFVLMSRMALTSSLGLMDLAALRFGIAGLLLLPVLIRGGTGGLKARQVLALVMLGGVGFAMFAYAGFKLAPASHGSAFLHGTLPLGTALLVWLIARRAPSRAQLAALALVGIGVIFLIWRSSSSSTATVLLGDLCLAIGALLWSGFGLYARHLNLPALRAAAIVATTSAAIFLPIYALLPNKLLFTAPLSDVAIQALFQGVLIGVVSVLVYTRAIILLGAERVTVFVASVPPLTVLGGAWLLSEPVSTTEIIGVIFITIGMVASLRKSV